MPARLSLTEDLTIYHALEQKTILLDALADADDLELDLMQVGEIDAAGLQLLILLKKEAQRAGKTPFVFSTDSKKRLIKVGELQIQARQLTVERQSEAVTRQLDGEKLLIALDNLLSNAIEFSPLGGTIRLHAKATDDRVRIACLDQGPGIAAEDVERIFEPFVQGGRASPTPRQGSGVGLSIVRELMTAMGGRVLLLPREPNAPGANFILEVPCEQPV